MGLRLDYGIQGNCLKAAYGIKLLFFILLLVKCVIMLGDYLKKYRGNYEN